ncbi:MAG: thiolase family protein [Planctomycetota bacterium]
MVPVPRDQEIVLAAGLRTAWAKAGGEFEGEDAAHLGGRVAREVLARTGLDPSRIDEVVAGCVGPPHDQANVGRVIALRAGVPQQVPARTVARNCASGIEAVASAAQSVRAGDAEMVLTVGVEVMSAYPLIFGDAFRHLIGKLHRAKTLGQRIRLLTKFRLGFLAPRIALMEGLTDPTCGLNMGQTAERIGREFGLSREAADCYACESHRRAQVARDRGRFKREILPVLPLPGYGKKPARASLGVDDSIRDGQTVEALSKLRPVFEKPDGRVTVGNACGITDGACALIVTTRGRALAEGLSPLATLRSVRWAGCDPSRMGLGPVYATAKVLQATGLELEDLGAIELNEAFASQVLAVGKAFASRKFAQEHLGLDEALGELDPIRLNPNGGAIALGHPVGATGSRLLLTAAHELAEQDLEHSLVTLCIGGGQGGAVLLERCDG